jgi:subtilase family serine protease
VAALVAALLPCAAVVEANAQQFLTGHVPHAEADSRAVARLAGTSRLNLAIGLPLRNQNELDELLAQLPDPASPNFGHYLSAEQFAAEFGPTEEDYQAVIQFARENGLVVTGTHPNRVLLDVSGDVSTIEKVFHVRMMTYDHALRGKFYAPDREPSLDLETQVLDISGLDNFVLPQPMNLKTMSLSEARSYVTGSGPGGYFIGKDFRAAYAPGVSLTGSGQVVGLLEFDGFYAGDVQKNAAQAGLPQVPTQTVLLDGFNGTPGSANIEVILDIMMASYMAPGLSKVMVYEGYTPNDILNRMATDNLAKQLSSSWGYGPINATTEQIFKEYIAQGQSLLQASGDSGAYTNGVMAPSDDPNLTVVGGTSLTTAGPGGPWQSEKAWSGSGGGVSTVYPIPSYQQGLNMAASGGSTKMRNLPDVALTADIQMFLIQSNGQAVAVGGTSAAAPLWSGFIALANQQAAGNKKSSVGFLNPLLYSIGNGKSYTTDLNDIRSGSNGEYSAVSGYDLTTGWGSPAGQHLINDLTNSSGAASFSLSASVSALSLPRSSSAGSTVSIVDQNGFSGSVSLVASGLPSGVTAMFSPASTTGNSLLTFTASSTATTGTFNVTVTGVSGTLSSMTSISLTVVAPSFTLSFAGAGLALPRGSSATGAVTVTPQNGFNSPVSLSASGLPSGVTAAFGAVSVAGTSLVTFAAGSTVLAGSFPITVNGVSGALKASASFTLTVLLGSSGTSLVNLAPAYNINAMVVDGLPFAGGGLDGGLNGSSTAYSANLLGVQQTIRGMLFYFGPANAADAVSGKTVSLPAGQFSNINLLATGVNGNQLAQVFKVTYSDGASSTFTQNLSDWFTPQNFAGETRAVTMPYRDNGQGQKDNRTFYLYEYTFALTANKTVASITLPNNRNVVVLAASLTNATAFNRRKFPVK